MSVTRRRGRDFCGRAHAERKSDRPCSMASLIREVAAGYERVARRYLWVEDVHPWVAQQRAEIEEANNQRSDGCTKEA